MEVKIKDVEVEVKVKGCRVMWMLRRCGGIKIKLV